MINVSRISFQSLLPAIVPVAEERCGFLMGKANLKDDFVELFFPVENGSKNKTVCFEITRDDYLKAEKKATNLGLRIIGVYHTHIDHPAIPSELDRKFAFPGFYHLIISLVSFNFSDVACWKINDQRIFIKENINFIN